MGADAEIRTLLARIAQFADTGDLDEYITMFTDDAVWAMPENPLLDMPASTRQGHDEILAGARSGAPPACRVRAATAGTCSPRSRSTSRTTRDATAWSYFLFFGTTSTAPTLRTMGQYDDVLVRGERGWQLAHRTITMG